MSGALYLGTSGFAYDEWKGVFYPQELKSREMLGFFASRFGSVEINYTFRRQPSEKTLATWTQATPERFRFSLKAHHRITHTLRLRDAGESVAYFLNRIRALGDRLGVVLFQCPPSLRFDHDLAQRFLEQLPQTGRFAMEFRHPSWEDARSLLRDRGVAWCAAETDEASSEPSWTPFAYLRLRKEKYEEDEIEAWARSIAGAVAEGNDVYCYFKHEEKGIGPVYAERLGRTVQAITRSDAP